MLERPNVVRLGRTPVVLADVDRVVCSSVISSEILRSFTRARARFMDGRQLASKLAAYTGACEILPRTYKIR